MIAAAFCTVFNTARHLVTLEAVNAWPTAALQTVGAAFRVSLTQRPSFALPPAGDTVNTASRMENSAREGCIHVSEATYRLVLHCPQFDWNCRGDIEVKGKGCMTTYEFKPVK